ncbi:LPS-induced tumor necrosis factor alpha factor [Penicillium verhagenii]|uniref:LPS-induced tumor necrosis factor alpha factor n=1 Tax=Penicillium verhagenii TaxID=1562060 RepID=UPI002544D891|nr:LPS-induced tumor necrosis factor alpha factor [Penicillium verhagenii]KAJ5939789.1 LPS-induced tumor necrosis factor alpha factor [Penicillium verhagenii]
MARTLDSEVPGLIPAETLQQDKIGPVSPMHTSEGTSTISSPPIPASISPPVPIYERNQPEDAPMPLSSLDMPEKEYCGQPPPNELAMPSASQQPMGQASNEKAYPGQPMPNHVQVPQLQQQQIYYTPFGQPTRYATAVPLESIQSAPCPVDCPVCGMREMTKTDFISGGTTHLFAALFCFCCCLGCIPYLIASLKNVEHRCGNPGCNARLAFWHKNSGYVDVLQKARPSVNTQESGLVSNAQPQTPELTSYH